jgi:hypothetical protein
MSSPVFRVKGGETFVDIQEISLIIILMEFMNTILSIENKSFPAFHAGDRGGHYFLPTVRSANRGDTTLSFHELNDH